MQSLKKLLKKTADPGLEKIIQRAQNMHELTTCVGSVLESDLAAQVVAVNMREDGELVVVCRTSAGASRIRYEEKSILQAVRSAGGVAVGVQGLSWTRTSDVNRRRVRNGRFAFIAERDFFP